MQAHDHDGGSIRAEPGFLKELADFWLTRVPSVYLRVEQKRGWLSWDRRVYLSIIRPGDAILDIGANVGGHTALFSHLAGRTGKVIAYEPVPTNLRRLRDNVARRCRYDNVEIRDLAVGGAGARGRVKIIVPAGDATQASLQPHASGSWADARPEPFECGITNLDADILSRRDVHVALMKIDVEGAELEVLRGAHDLLLRDEPLVYCEVFDEWTRAFLYEPADLIEFMRALDYTEARVFRDDGFARHSLGALSALDIFGVSTNVLFAKGKHAQRLSVLDRHFGTVVNSSR
ncbi:MAG TPA: FkbM family methyltransferase [Gemmatimonadaceae bacterium]|nr:FkbM family methyltransferase [Gemmatimonadaceae bacterium]